MIEKVTKTKRNGVKGEAEGATVPGTALLVKALDIVDFLAKADGRVKLRDISEQTGITKSTLHRILSALSLRGMVRQDPRDHAYALGPRFTELAGAVARHTELITLAALPLKQLSEMLGERVNLGVLDNAAQRTIAVWKGFDDGSPGDVGILKPLYCTALGKALLAFAAPETRASLLAEIRFEDVTVASHKTLDTLVQDLAAIEARGFARDDEEVILGTRCVAVPICDREGRAIAAISVSAPKHRMTPTRSAEIASALKMAARDISVRLDDHAPQLQASLDVGQSARAIHADRVLAHSIAGIVRDGRGYIAADGLGGRILRVAGGTTETLARFEGAIAALTASRGKLIVACGRNLNIFDPRQSDADPIRWLSFAEQGADRLASDIEGRVFAGVGPRVVEVAANGVCTDLRTDRKPGTALGWVNRRLCYVSENGLCDLNGRILRQLDWDPTDLVELPDGRIAFAGAVDWALPILSLDAGVPQVSVPLPLPRTTSLSLDFAAGELLVGSMRSDLPNSLIELAPLSGGVLRIDLSSIP